MTLYGYAIVFFVAFALDDGVNTNNRKITHIDICTHTDIQKISNSPSIEFNGGKFEFLGVIFVAFIDAKSFARFCKFIVRRFCGLLGKQLHTGLNVVKELGEMTNQYM